jgi:hypothetical protein
MSAALADTVAAHIEGSLAADLVLDDIRRGTSHPDALHVALMQVSTTLGVSGLVGAHRRLAKVLERVL